MINPISSSVTPANASPIPWPQRLTNVVKALWRITRPQSSHATTADTVAADQPVLLALRASLLAGRTDVVCLTVEGEVNSETYTILVETACLHYQQGRRYLLLDLRQTTRIEVSGLFALCNIARLYSGLPLLDPDLGWAALRAATEAVTPTLAERVKVLAPSSVATAALASSSLCQFLEQYPDQASALTALPNP
ncbi:MAG: hypothetical protein DYG89_13990 [Caldilinea sp. CFX5]|nr:hypothetical protein [Caldilinea sp. CFX5]